MTVRCVAFDADDTLWDFTTAMWEALHLALEAGRAVDAEAVAGITVEELQGLRDRLAGEAEQAADGRTTLAGIRRRSFAAALAEHAPRAGTLAVRADEVAEAMGDAYFAHRHHQIRLHPEVTEVLAELGSRYVLGLVTNGNTDPERGGLASCFAFRLAADEVGIRKPDVRIFRMAAAAAGCHPNELVYVGDQPDKDVAAPQAAGCRAVWLNRTGAPCPPGIEPDATVTSLAELPAVLAGFDAADDEALGQAGVGPHPEPWPAGDHYDPVLLAGGDRRNVVDRYRYWSEEAIVADLRARCHPFHVAVENWRHDRNIGAVVRNANAFGAAAVHIVGRRRWNRRGAMATDRYLEVVHHDTLEGFAAWARSERLAVVGIDNVPGAVALESVDLPERCVLLFGQEGPGLSPPALALVDQVCAIAQFGSTRSVNAGVASGIAMHAWIRRHALPAPADGPPAGWEVGGGRR